jgi:hypothetical protein
MHATQINYINRLSFAFIINTYKPTQQLLELFMILTFLPHLIAPVVFIYDKEINHFSPLIPFNFVHPHTCHDMGCTYLSIGPLILYVFIYICIYIKCAHERLNTKYIY